MTDIEQIQIVRNSVNENKLSDPSKITDADCEDYITKRGKAWVALDKEKIVGFAIIDSLENSIWALFIHRNYENSGIGKSLHNKMVSWHFNNSENELRLSTERNTRALGFYKKFGWRESILLENGEIELLLDIDNYKANE